MQSTYVDVFIGEIRAFNEAYSLLLASADLTWLLPGKGSRSPAPITNGTIAQDEATLALASPLEKLTLISGRINALLWECLTRVANRAFVEGFASAKKCTNEGRALMQLDYQQFLSHLERIIGDYLGPSSSDGPSPGTSTKLAKALLTAEKEFVEEYVKAYYLTEAIFLDWIRQRQDTYTGKQVLSLVAAIAGDNRKLKSSLLAAIDSHSAASCLPTTAADANSSQANLSLG